MKTLLESGDLSLSVAATAQNHIRKENQRRKDMGKPILTLPEQREVLELVTGSSRREAEQSLTNHFGQTSEKRMSFDASPELVAKIEKLMDLMAHKNFKRDLGKMVELLVDGELARYDKKLKLDNVSSEPIATTETGTSPLRAPLRLRRSSSWSPSTRALVWTNSKGRCTYQDPLTGKKCQATHGLEVDHRLAHRKGGANEPENLTLLCRSHNHWKSARQVE